MNEIERLESRLVELKRFHGELDRTQDRVVERQKLLGDELATIGARVAELEAGSPARPATPEPVEPPTATSAETFRPYGTSPAEALPAPPAPPRHATTPAPVPTSGPAVSHIQPARSWADGFEALLQPKVMGVVGAITVFLGLAFLIAFQTTGAWATPEVRISAAALLCVLLGSLGVWLAEVRDLRTLAILLLGTATAGLYALIAVAAIGYDLIPPAVGFVAAAITGSLAVLLARRYDNEPLAGLAVAGALLAPALVGVVSEPGSAVFLGLAVAAALAVSLHTNWRLPLAATIVAIPQVAFAAAEMGEAMAFVFLGLLWLAMSSVAVFAIVRERSASAIGSFALVYLAGITAAFAFIGGIQWRGDETLTATWLLGLGAISWAYAATLISLGVSRAKAEAVAIVGSAAILTGFGVLLDGVALVAAITAKAALVAVLVRGRSMGERIVPWLTFGLAAAITVFGIASPTFVFVNGLEDSRAWDAVFAMAILFGGLATLALTSRHEDERTFALMLAGGFAAYLAIGLVDGALLVAAFVGIGLATWAALRALGNRVEAEAAFWFGIGLAAAHVLLFEAPPVSLIEGPPDWSAAAAALAAILGGLAIRAVIAPERRALVAHVAVGTLVFLGSISIIEVYPDARHADMIGTGVQLGQALLSGFWGFAGFLVLLFGIGRHRRDSAIFGMALFALALTKLVFFDLANLEPTYRGISFLVVGLLLLGTTYAYQRLGRRTE